MSPVFITGGSGYIGKRLIRKLVSGGYDVTALVRKGSENKLPKGVRAIIADPFNPSSFLEWIPPHAIFVQLLGVAHPSPRKKELFREIDLRSLRSSADAAVKAGVQHFIYLSVAMAPNKLMKDFQQARKEGEDYLRSKELACTFIRPWYVLGPGHWWPVILLPVYGLAKLVPSWRQMLKPFELVTIGQLVKTIVSAIESAPQKLRVIEIPQIKRSS